MNIRSLVVTCGRVVTGLLGPPISTSFRRFESGGRSFHPSPAVAWEFIGSSNQRLRWGLSLMMNMCESIDEVAYNFLATRNISVALLFRSALR